MRDTLPEKCLEKECGIINLDTSDNKGNHWCCYYKDGNNKFYFSSFGDDPPQEIRDYLGENIMCSTFQIQEFNEECCGEYAILILYLLNRNIPFQKAVLALVQD